MNKIFLLVLMIATLHVSSQTTDEIAMKLLQYDKSKVGEFIDSTGLWHYWLEENGNNDQWTYAIETEGNLKVWVIDYTQEKASRVAVNFRHDNKNQLIELMKIKESKNFDEIHTGKYSTDVYYKKGNKKK